MSMRPLVPIGLALAALLGIVVWVLAGLGDDDGRGDARPGAEGTAAGPAIPTAAGLDAPGSTPEAVDPRRVGVEAETAPEEPVEEALAIVDPRESVLVGRVVDEGGAPIAGATVVLAGTLEPTFALSSARELGRVTWEASRRSGPEGAFRFEGVPAHGLQLHLLLEVSGRPTLEVLAVLVVPGEVTDVGDVEMPLGGEVRGWVVDEMGNHVAGAEVIWTRAFGGDWSFLQRGAPGLPAGRTDAQGQFRATDLPPGVVAFAVLSEGKSAGWSLPVTVHADDVVRDIEITVRVGRSVLGEVVTPEGLPVPGAVVVAWPQGTGPARLRGETGEDGWFRLAGGVPGQRYALSIAAEGYRDGWENRLRLPAATEPDDPVRLELQPVVPIHVTVLDAATGTPIEGARVAWAGQATGRRWGARESSGMLFAQARSAGITDAEGTLTLTDARDIGRALLVRAEGYAAAVHRTGHRNSDEGLTAVETVVRLERGTSLRVRVRGAAGPVAQAAVGLRLSPPNFFSSSSAVEEQPDPYGRREPLLERGVTDAEGLCSFENLAAATYMVEVHAEGHARVFSEEAWVELGFASYDLSVYLPRSATLRGTVRVHGEPAPDQAVIAIAPDGLTRKAVSDEEGNYVLEDLTPGLHRVTTYRELFTSGLDLILTIGARSDEDRGVEVSLGEGETRYFDLEGESEGVSISGTLYVNHDTLSGATIRAEEILDPSPGNTGSGWQRRASGAQATSGPDGEFLLPDLPPGQWRVTAEQQSGRGTRVPVAQMVVEIEDKDVERDLHGAATSLEVELIMPDDASPPRRLWVVLRPDMEGGGVPGFSTEHRWSLAVGGSLTAKAELFPEGAYWIDVAGRSHWAPRQELELVAGRPERLEIALQKRSQ